MFLSLLILISVSAFLIGYSLGRRTPPKFKSAPTTVYFEDEDYKNFLNYDGNIQ